MLLDKPWTVDKRGHWVK